MYRRPKFIEVLHEIRQTMAADADFDLQIFASKVRMVAENGRERTSLQNLDESSVDEISDDFSLSVEGQKPAPRLPNLGRID